MTGGTNQFIFVRDFLANGFEEDKSIHEFLAEDGVVGRVRGRVVDGVVALPPDHHGFFILVEEPVFAERDHVLVVVDGSIGSKRGGKEAFPKELNRLAPAEVGEAVLAVRVGVGGEELVGPFWVDTFFGNLIDFL
jgi:hypothetical protein